MLILTLHDLEGVAVADRLDTHLVRQDVRPAIFLAEHTGGLAVFHGWEGVHRTLRDEDIAETGTVGLDRLR